MIAILSDGTEQHVGQLLYEEVRRKGGQAQFVSLEGKEIRACTGCSSCSGETYGRCVQMDDMQGILKLLSVCSTWVLVCPIRFGSYSAIAKTAQERTSSLGDPRYYVQKGELVKGSGQGFSAFHAIGVKDACSDKESNSFLGLHRENVHIMNCPGKAWVVTSAPDKATIAQIAEVLTHDQ